MEEAQKKLSLAVKMLLTSLLLGIPRVALEFKHFKKIFPPNFQFNYLIVAFSSAMLIFGFLIFNVSKRKNWARILFLLLTLYGLKGAYSQALASFKYSTVGASIGLLQILLNIAGLWSLFIGPAAQCFRNKD